MRNTKEDFLSCQLNFGNFFRMDDSGTGAVSDAAAPCSLVTVKRTGQSIDAPDGRSPGGPVCEDIPREGEA